MAHPNADLLNKGYDAFEKGDLETVQGLFTEDAVFHVPGRSRLSGDYRGRDEVLAFIRQMSAGRPFPPAPREPHRSAPS